jgi:hypothetical protein
VNVRIVTILMAVLSTALSAIGQDCNSLIAAGIRNVRSSKSQGAATAMKYYSNCGKNYASMSDAQLASVEATIYGEGSGSASYSRSQREERLNEWCVANKEIAESNRNEVDEASDIFAPALAAWNVCNAMASNSVQILPSITPDDQTVDIKIKYSGPAGPVMLQGVPTQRFNCTYTGSDATPVTLPHALSTSLTNVHCERSASTAAQRDGTNYAKLERATITVQTAGDSLQLFFPEKWDPELPQAEAAKIKGDIETLKGIIPTGTIFAFVGTTPPPGWALCNGAIVPRTGEYSQLFAVVGETYGRGDGSSTFRLPDLRGRFLRGALTATQVGTAGGVSTPSATVALVNGDWKGSDYHWGETPWANGPNPARSGTYNVAFAQDSGVPPHVQISYIIKK